jgi:Zn-dependent protease/predicted transcriptional regulator
MGGRFKIATLRGIPVYVSTSWIWVAALYTYSFYVLFSQRDLTLSTGAAVGFAVFAAVLFFGSVFVHELAHAVTARSLGLAVAAITLEFWGGKTETQADRRGPGAEFLVAIVGPGSTLVLAGVFWLLSRTTAPGTTLQDLFGRLAWINMLLGGVNAIPGFPLDGGRALLAIVWGATKNRNRAYQVAGTVGMVIGAGFGILGLQSFTTTGNSFGIWFLFLAYVLITSSRSLRAQMAVRSMLEEGRAADAMSPPPSTVPATMALSQVLDAYLRDHPQEAFPVVRDGEVVGMISLSSARKVGSRDPMKPATEGMLPLAEVPVVDPNDPLDLVVDRLRGRNGLVLQNGRLVGTISTADIGRWYERRAAGGAPVAWNGAVPPRPDR